MSIRIDKEFESLIPPLSADEFKQLEENCVKDGIRDPLVVWRVPSGDDILIDGHNRWKIAAKHGGIQFETVRKEFDNRNEVIAWICNNQLGRRNISMFDRVTLEDRKNEYLRNRQKSKSAVTKSLNLTKHYKEILVMIQKVEERIQPITKSPKQQGLQRTQFEKLDE